MLLNFLSGGSVWTVPHYCWLLTTQSSILREWYFNNGFTATSVEVSEVVSLVSYETINAVHWLYPCGSADDYPSSTLIRWFLNCYSPYCWRGGCHQELYPHTLGESSLWGGLTCLLTHILWDRCCHFVWLLGAGRYRICIHLGDWKIISTSKLYRHVVWATMTCAFSSPP